MEIGKTKVRFGIRAKILTSFLAVSLVAVGVISIFALRNMSIVGNTATQNIIGLGEDAVAESVAALQDTGRRIVILQADNVAKDVRNLIERDQDIAVSELRENKELAAIAVQKVGQTGSTMVYDMDGVIYFHANPELVGANFIELVEDVPGLQKILESSLIEEAAGYYEWRDDSGDIRLAYIYAVPVQGAPLVVAATAYIDEFSRRAEETESRIITAASDITLYIERQMDVAQWTFIVVILCMTAIIAILASFLARTITDPITAVTKGSDVIASGNLDHTIKVNTGDEIQLLAEQFNNMTHALKESLSNLEEKIEDRTRKERQRAEQLRTINEISRKISSIMNLDELLPYVANLLRHTFSYHNVNIFLFEPSSGKLILNGSAS
jgi:HAMP domain-containing protein